MRRPSLRPYRVFRRGPVLINSVATAAAIQQTLSFTVQPAHGADDDLRRR
jgi:hypothetical protein